MFGVFLLATFSFYSSAEMCTCVCRTDTIPLYLPPSETVFEMNFTFFAVNAVSQRFCCGYRLLGRALHKGFPGISTCQFSSSLPSFPSFILCVCVCVFFFDVSFFQHNDYVAGEFQKSPAQTDKPIRYSYMSTYKALLHCYT